MNSQYQKQFDSLQLGVAIVAQDGVIQTCNAAFRSLIDSRVDDLSNTLLEDMVGNRCDTLQQVFERANEEGRIIRERRVACKQMSDNLRYFNLQARPMHWRGQPVVMLALWDVTSSEQTRQIADLAGMKSNSQLEELFRNRLLLQALMDHVPVGIAVLDHIHNRISYVSRYGCELLGVSREDLLRIPLDEVPDRLYLYDMDREARAVGDEMPLLRASHQVIRDEEWILHQPGRPEITIVINAGPLISGSGEVIGSIIVWHDVTRLHEAEQQARDYAEQMARSNRDLQDFASIVSHDLQEPLRKVRLFGNLLKERFGDLLMEEGRDYIDRMQGASQRMQQMIDNLLDYSRVSTRGRAFAPVDLLQVVGGVLVDLEGRLEESGGQVEVGDLPTVDADATQMQQLFQNLIGNALKYHRPGVPPVVQVSAERIGGRDVEIHVQDNGIGFEMQYLEHLFKPFARLHGRSEYEGTGIGLAICRRIVERHGGNITATSVPGEGTTFIVRLPAHS